MSDGTKMTRADLPPKETSRWVARRKASVVNAVNAGLIEVEEACDMYNLSAEEFQSWCTAQQSFGAHALRATTLQNYR